ncbi:MAG TPA: hypothetical protein VGV07_00015 [Devosia sp.]|jgi:hypothetical protein|uniref:hypothetical protein n=1 Tax=Devosia sp. TaxID=1871048 RepID=UPI002DDD8CD3|nr:hypothetical protein [Devosia sp.]HEV2513604.1 hypothetical protein [Devosia sp.]
MHIGNFLLLPAIAAWGVLLGTAHAQERHKIPFDEQQVVICSDGNSSYRSAIVRLNREEFHGLYTIVQERGTFDQNKARRIYIGTPPSERNKPACLAEDPQLADFLDYVLRYAPREMVVPMGRNGSAKVRAVATGYQSPEGTVVQGGAVAVYLCFAVVADCVDELTTMLFGLRP